MVWPTLGSRTAKEQEQELQNAPFRSQIFTIFFASGGKGALTLLTKILRTFLCRGRLQLFGSGCADDSAATGHKMAASNGQSVVSGHRLLTTCLPADCRE